MGFGNIWRLRGSTFLLVLLTILEVNLCQGETLVLDVNSDATKEWLNNDCVYVQDYADLMAFSCPVNLSEEADIFPKIQGFWTPCGKKTCEIQYFGGFAPFPQKVTFSFISTGALSISVSSKYSLVDQDFTPIDVISAENMTNWANVTMDLSEATRTRVLDFTLENIDGMLILDKIIIDLGPNGVFPTEPPPTTSSPIENEVITVDSEQDFWVLWNGDCTYVDDLYYLWVFGCPVSTSLENSTSIGFWDPCQAKKCRINYHSNTTILPISPKVITLDYLVEGTGKIKIFGGTDKGEVELETYNGTGSSWTTGSLSLGSTGFKDIYIELIPGKDGVAIVDKIKLNLAFSTTTTTTTPKPSGSNKLVKFTIIELLFIQVFVIVGYLWV